MENFDYQGRKKEQYESSSMIALWAMIGIGVLLILTSLYTYIFKN